MIKKSTESMSTQRLAQKIRIIGCTEYNCEDQFSKKKAPAIGLSLRHAIDKKLSTGGGSLQIVKDIRGYGDYSCFIKDVNNNTDPECIYVSISYASCGELTSSLGFDQILIRTAVNDHDYTGGSNNYCVMDDLCDKIQEMYEKMLSDKHPSTSRAVTVDQLLQYCIKEHKAGHGDYVVFVTNDEEANGYHALWYLGDTAENLEPYRRDIEESNHDLSILDDTDKAIYMG